MCSVLLLRVSCVCVSVSFFLPLLSAATVGEVVSMVLPGYLHLPVWRLVVAPLALAFFDAAWDVLCWEEARCVVLEAADRSALEAADVRGWLI